MATWALTTFTTAADLATIEQEITNFTSLGTESYSCDAVNLAAASPAGTGIDVSGGKGIYEFLGVVNTTGAIKDGKSLTISFQDSADDETYAEIHTGQRVYYRAASGADVALTAGDVLFKWVVPSDAEDYVKAVIASDATNSGKIDIYAVSVWSDKIAIAKQFMKEDIQNLFINAGFKKYIDFDDDELIEDLLDNKDILDYASHYLTLSLIYEDMTSSGDENDVFKMKADRYRTRYEQRLQSAYTLKNLDFDQDGTVDDYMDETTITRRITR